MNFFKDFEIREIIARPRCRVNKLPEYGYENWKGDMVSVTVVKVSRSSE